jgi:hypothetical protein
MKAFWNTAFFGHWPVGTAAIVVAHEPDDAAALLEAELAKQGLPQKIDASQMFEIDLSATGVVVLNDGEY